MARPHPEDSQRVPDISPSVQKHKVLVLDDHPTVRSVLGRVLHEHGYEPINAASVDEALGLLAATKVAAIILDVKLSGGRSGLELLTQLEQRTMPDSVPTIVMTGVALTDEEQQRIADHRAYLLYKPEGLTALVGFLHQLTDSAPKHI